MLVRQNERGPMALVHSDVRAHANLLFILDINIVHVEQYLAFSAKFSTLNMSSFGSKGGDTNDKIWHLTVLYIIDSVKEKQ